MIGSYLDEVRAQRAAWLRKPVLRRLYCHWYEECAAWFAPLTPVVEVGGGCGNFKEYYKKGFCSDVFIGGPWIDAVMDAQELALLREGTGNLLGFDVLHHMWRPLDFLRQASRALKPNGRLVLCEPALTPWSRFVYTCFHHEAVDLSWNSSTCDSAVSGNDKKNCFANMAIPEVLLWRDRVRTLAALPELRLVSARKFGFILYPLTGGFGYRCYLPDKVFPLMQRLEDALMRPFANWLTGMRLLVVLEKRDTAVGGR